MCLSVNKAYESCCESMNKILEARQDRHKKIEEKENVDSVEVVEEKVFISDQLALMTQMTRKFFNKCKLAAGKFQESTFYRILTRTTQPAHVASMIIVLIISYSIFHDHKSDETITPRTKSPLTTFIYLGSVAAHFGAQIWMTFVSGLALYFSLPRHTFGLCQEVLFPKYFLMNTLFSTVTVITFAKINANLNDFRGATQLAILSFCLLIEMIIYFYLTPTLLHYMRLKYQFERTLGNGEEVGYQKTLPAFDCEEYKNVHKKFRRVHMTCAIGNIVAICCTCAHLYYIASKISIV